MNGQGCFLILTQNPWLHSFFFNHSKLALNCQWSVQLCSDGIFHKCQTWSTITYLCVSQHDTISCKSLVSSGSGSLPRACLLQNMFSPRHLQDLTCSVIRVGLRHHIQSASPLITCLPQKKAWLNRSTAHLPHYALVKVSSVWMLWLDV